MCSIAYPSSRAHRCRNEHQLSPNTSDNTLVIEVRALPADRLSVIAEIDRSEHIGTIFEMQDGDLTSRPVDIDLPRWNPEGSGPHSVMGFIDDLRPILGRGATLLAAFVQDAIAGVAVVEEHFEGDMAWLVFLHVSNEHRRHGVGSALWVEAVDRARAAGARSMHVSATPSGSAVGFYLAHGCKVATSPHHELYAEEPEDVHLLAMID
jgi:ribosomal protein S18 acetylase RimI-like enzyme